uniref:Uncharacterized protein n=1 Tax=Chaetoceros debilis TaxID=122233 RepID=A0A7S3QHI0_9STRA|mmetsp:Transcript_10792/g.15748  ORF Transcript_10792/g.15748 Transcript_10792/m.15748 type:complete len:101 (+) Transcript_10792:103-405(+)
MNLLKPSPNINYDFVCSVYGGFTLLGIVLYILETCVFRKYNDDASVSGELSTTSNASLKEIAESTEGLYLIFSPFFPCLLWALFVRREWCELAGVKEKRD